MNVPLNAVAKEKGLLPAVRQRRQPAMEVTQGGGGVALQCCPARAPPILVGFRLHIHTIINQHPTVFAQARRHLSRALPRNGSSGSRPSH